MIYVLSSVFVGTEQDLCRRLGLGTVRNLFVIVVTNGVLGSPTGLVLGRDRSGYPPNVTLLFCSETYLALKQHLSILSAYIRRYHRVCSVDLTASSASLCI